MKIDTTNTITLLVALIALISPIITAFINNRYSREIAEIEAEKLKYNQESMRVKAAFENLLNSYGAYMGNSSFSNEAEFKKAYYSCLPFVPEKEYPIFQEFYSKFLNGNGASTREYLESNLVPAIRKILKEM